MTNKLIATIKNIQHYYEIESFYLLYIDKKDNLRCISKDNFKEIWYFENCYNFFINKKYVVCGMVGNEKTTILNLNDGTKVKEFDFDLNIKGKRTELYYYGSTYRNNEPVILKFDLSKNELAGIFPSLLGIRTIIDDTYYLAVQKKRILNKKLIENDTTLWQFDISQFGTYKDKKIFADKEPEVRQREINRVYYHNNKIIVTLSRAIIALNPETGQLLWKIDIKEFNPYDIIFNGSIGYVGDGLYYVVIDIENGQKIYEREFDHTLRVNIEGYSLSHILYIGLTLHENHLWFTHEDKGHQFLLKANPKNGDIEDGMLLETKLPTHPPQFDENRMYILDQEGNLYIYERT